MAGHGTGERPDGGRDSAEPAAGEYHDLLERAGERRRELRQRHSALPSMGELDPVELDARQEEFAAIIALTSEVLRLAVAPWWMPWSAALAVLIAMLANGVLFLAAAPLDQAGGAVANG